MRAIPLIVALALALAAATPFAPSVTAQPPYPTPTPIPPGQTPPPAASPSLPPAAAPTPTPRIIPIQGETTIAPGESVIFRRLSDGASIVVSNNGRVPATAAYDGEVLTASVPPLGPGEFLSGGGPVTRGNPRGVTCSPVDARRTVVRCEVRPDGVESAHVSFTIASDPDPSRTPVPQSSLPPGLTAIPLATGCNNVALTFPDRTSIADFYRAVVPASAPASAVWSPTSIVEAIWRYDAANRRFLGWSPLPAAPSDFERVNRLDTVFICVGEAGRLIQPAIP